MTHKERVLKSLAHIETDRVPFMYRDVPEVRSRLKRDLNLKSDEELFQYLDIDFRWVGPEYRGPDLNLPNGNRRDIWGVEWKYTKFSEGAGYWNEAFYPLADVTDPGDMEYYAWPSIEDWDFSMLESLCDSYADYAIMTSPGPASPGILQFPIQTLIGAERSLTEPYLNPLFFERLIEKVLEFQISFIDKIFSSAGGKIDFFRIGDDFGTQQGLLFDVETWKSYFHMAFKSMADTAKKYGAHYYQHSCGAIRELIPSFIEAGVEVLDPLQVKAFNMDPAGLKKDFGNLVTFSGGIDEQELLPNGTPIMVKDEVEKIIDIMACGGGYFLGPTHNFQDDCPTENIIAMYETARKYGSS